MRKSAIGGMLGFACAGAALASGCSHGMEPSPGFVSAGTGGASVDASFLDNPPSGPRPTFPTTVSQSAPPPPISGGTLLVTQDGKTAVAADSDRDAVYGIDLATFTVRFTTTLKAGDEPGRLVEDGAGHIHVALRGAGSVVTLDPSQGTVLERDAVCPAPRGLAWDASTDTITVACATGELVTLPAGGGGPTRTLTLERDLRDVVVQNGALAVSSFRSAQILRLGADESIARRDQLPSPDSQRLPHVVWRTVAGPLGSLVSVHQAESTLSLSTTIPGGYGGGIGGGPIPIPPSLADAGPGLFTSGQPGQDDAGDLLLTGDPLFSPDGGSSPDGGDGSDGATLPSFQSATPENGAVASVLTVIASDGTVHVNRAMNGVLPVDVAVSPDGSNIAVAEPGSAFTPTLGDIAWFNDTGAGSEADIRIGNGLQITAVAFEPGGNLLAFSREPAELLLVSEGAVASSLGLSTTSRDDTGHDIFHTQAGAMIACASCHPEGGDDSHVWLLDNEQRKTPSLRGTIAGTAPYHWPGDEMDFPTLVNDVYITRMSGAQLDGDQMKALTSWAEAIPAPPAPSWVDSSAVAQGKALFERSDTQCTTCHSGSKFTNNATVDVGTGGAFQVPPLVGVGWRTPLMHNGCAATIADRFGTCATSSHGNTSSLSSTDVSNLTAYLETL